MSERESAAELLRWGATELRAAGITYPRMEAELLLANAAGVPRQHLMLKPDQAPAPLAAARYRRDVLRRAGHEPLAYITGTKEFMSLTLEVTPDVLVPRPDTETLVEGALDFLRGRSAAGRRLHVADVGTGSGAIGLAIAHYCPQAEVWGIDISPAAIAVAKRNVLRHGLAERMHVLAGDLLDAHGLGQDLRFDLVVANLPYVPTRAFDALAPEVAVFEPRVALHGGPDGLDVIRRLVPAAAQRLHPGGALGLECDPEQYRLLTELLLRAGFEDVTVSADLAGRPRTVWGIMSGASDQGGASG